MIFIILFFSCKIDSLINGGRRRCPPPISLSILYEKNKEYIQGIFDGLIDSDGNIEDTRSGKKIYNLTKGIKNG